MQIYANFPTLPFSFAFHILCCAFCEENAAHERKSIRFVTETERQMDKAFFSDTPHIQYGETDMEPLVRNACRFGCDIQIVCTRGTAEISTGIQSYGMRRGTELFLFGGTLVQVSDPSPDFTVRMLLYPKDVVIKAILPIDSDFLNYLHEYPFLDHIGGAPLRMSGRTCCSGWTWPVCCLPARCSISGSR